MIKTLFKYFVELTGNPVASSLLRKFTQSRASKPVVRPFAKVYDIQKDEMEHPINHYKSLHALFTRRLKSDVRPIDQSPLTIVSPVDGVVNDMGEISENQNFYIKDQLYHLQEILGDTNKANTYQGGYFFILYLSPRHYHRMHYPIKGNLVSRFALGEKSFPVNDLGMKWGDQPFSTNYRIISELETSYGQMAMIKVGALNINSIQLTNSADTFEKGDEVGYFSFGSTVILLLEKHQLFTPKITLHDEVVVGQPIGEWVE